MNYVLYFEFKDEFEKKVIMITATITLVNIYRTLVMSSGMVLNALLR